MFLNLLAILRGGDTCHGTHVEVRGQLVGLGPSLPPYMGLHDQIWVGRLWGKNLSPDPVTVCTPFIVFLRLPSLPSEREETFGPSWFSILLSEQEPALFVDFL